MNEKKTYKIDIFNESYSLVSDESQEHITGSAFMVDSLMKQIAENTKLTDSTKIAVLAALQIASKLIHTERDVQKNQQLQERLATLLDDGTGDLELGL